jgi:hypothetical protein
MSNYIPLIVNVGTGQIQELPTSDNLDLSFNNISNVVDITGSGTANIGALIVNGISNLGSNSNVIITGGSASDVLSTDGAGNLSWVAGGGAPGGSNTQIQYNDANAFNGIANLTFDNVTGFITVSTANVTNANVSFSNFTEKANTTAQTISGSNPTFDAVNGTIQTYTVNTNFDFHSSDISNVASGGSIVMLMNINGSSLSMGTTINIKWVNGDKTFSNTSGTTDMICLVRIDNTYYGTLTKGYA